MKTRSHTSGGGIEIGQGDLVFIPEGTGYICGIAEVNESGAFCCWEDSHRPVEVMNFFIMQQHQIEPQAGMLVGRYFNRVIDISDAVRPLRKKL